MSTHEVKVIRISQFDVHPNADMLEIVPVWGYTSCVRKGDFQVGDLVAYIEPDYEVPIDQPEFAFLKEKAKDNFAHIKASKLRGVVSYGLLIKARPHWKEGDNVLEELGVRRWEPKQGFDLGKSENIAGPNIYATKYDMENYQKYPNILKELEPVVITEKINGANSRFVFHDGVLHVGSHTNWKKEDEKDGLWKTAKKYDLMTKLAKYPDHVFYGEIYGFVGGNRYGNTKDEALLAFFDILYQGKWLNASDFTRIIKGLDLPSVPVIYTGAWNPSLATHATGKSTVPGAPHIREGVVVKPMTERWDAAVGRVIFKIINPDYLGGKK